MVVIALNPEITEEAAELDRTSSSGSAAEDEAPTGAGVQPDRRRSRRMTVSNGTPGKPPAGPPPERAATGGNGQHGRPRRGGWRPLGPPAARQARPQRTGDRRGPPAASSARFAQPRPTGTGADPPPAQPRSEPAEPGRSPGRSLPRSIISADAAAGSACASRRAAAERAASGERPIGRVGRMPRLKVARPAAVPFWDPAAGRPAASVAARERLGTRPQERRPPAAGRPDGVTGPAAAARTPGLTAPPPSRRR